MSYFPPNNAVQYYHKDPVVEIDYTLTGSELKISCNQPKPDTIEKLFASDNFNPLEILLDTSHKNHKVLRSWLNGEKLVKWVSSDWFEDIYIDISKLPEPIDLKPMDLVKE